LAKRKTLSKKHKRNPAKACGCLRVGDSEYSEYFENGLFWRYLRQQY